MTIKNALKKAGIAVIGIAVAIGLYLLSPHEKSIFEIAKPIADSSLWAKADQGRLANASNEEQSVKSYYFWLNDHELLSFRPSATGLQGDRTILNSRYGTVSSSPVAGFQLKGSCEPFSVSKDGKALLWYDWVARDNGKVKAVPYISTLDGFSTKRLLPNALQSYTWSSDSTSLLFLDLYSSSIEVSAFDIAKNRYTRIRKDSWQIGGQLSEISCFKPDKFLIMGNNLKSGSELALYESDLRNPNIPPKEFPFALQKGEQETLSLLSPKGDRVIVMMERENSLGENLFQSFARILSPNKRTYTERWMLYDLHGNRTEIGKFEYIHLRKSNNTFKLYHQIGRFQWTPDGKNLSFIYEGKLYLLPIK